MIHFLLKLLFLCIYFDQLNGSNLALIYHLLDLPGGLSQAQVAWWFWFCWSFHPWLLPAGVETMSCAQPLLLLVWASFVASCQSRRCQRSMTQSGSCCGDEFWFSMLSCCEVIMSSVSIFIGVTFFMLSYATLNRSTSWWLIILSFEVSYLILPIIKLFYFS